MSAPQPAFGGTLSFSRGGLSMPAFGISVVLGVCLTPGRVVAFIRFSSM